MTSTKDPATTTQNPPSGQLRRNVLGAPSMAFLVIAMAAPLSASATGVALTVGLGNGIGAPGAFVLIVALLLIFSVGFAAMAGRIVNAGAFYAYVGAAFGFRMGAASGFIATMAYNLLSAFVFGISGFYGAQALNGVLGTDIPWWAVAMVFLVAAFAMSYFGTELGARITGTLLVLECLFLVVIDVSVLINKGASAFSWEVFAPSNVFSGNIGMALAMVFLCFIGFEATAIFSEEAKDPRRTVGRATRIAIIVTGALYVFTAWAVIANFGTTESVDVAQGENAGTMILDTITGNLGAFGGGAFTILIITSSLAVAAAIHGAASRYIFVMSRSRLLPGGLSKVHSRFQSPVRAQLVQGAFVLVLLVVWAIIGLDPFVDMGVLGTLGSIAIMVLQTLVSFAVFAFFRRLKDARVWTTIVAPLVAGAAMLVVLAVAVAAWPVLIGSDAVLLQLVPIAIPLAGVIGWFVAHRRGAIPDELETRKEFV